MKNWIGVIGLLFFSLASCSTEDAHPPDRFVIEAYLFANEPVSDISVKQLTSINGTQDAMPLADASVTLIRGVEEFPLTYNPSTLKFESSGNSPLSVSSGEAFTVHVESQDRIASASTIIPPIPQGLKISSPVVAIPQIDYEFGLVEKIRDLFAAARLQLSWNNPDDQYYFVVIEKRAKTVDSILPSQLPQQATDLLSTFRFISEPTKEPVFEIVGIALETYGLHVAKVYRVNPEYVMLFQNPPQDSRDLNEPATNIMNGLGIFSAFASDSVFFEVTR